MTKQRWNTTKRAIWLVVGVNTGRRFVGIEKEEKYFEIALKRIREAERMAKCDLFREEKPAPHRQMELV